MKFGRKSPAADALAGSDAPEEKEPATGPFDIADVDVENDGVERVDLGGMLIAPAEGLELRLQVDEKTGEVQSVLVAGPTGAVEVRAFAAQRSGGLWDDVRKEIAADTAQKGGTATEREGRHGTELVCQAVVRTPDGKSSTQPSRIAGIEGPRWFLRATFLGRPAVEPEQADAWEDAVEKIVVRRGDSPMAPGEPLPIELPPQARRMSDSAT
ncbi:MAG: DUF3710 domain-containing protein [Nocardioides sp.]|nr:DUF3710 domain-containing protein [Nocardioides sp.]